MPESAVPTWMAAALCATEGRNAEFFVVRGQDDRPAKAVCARCPVRDDCLGYALDNGIAYGIWGGTSARERSRLGATSPSRPETVEAHEVLVVSRRGDESDDS